jgi:hypothetical protein
LSEIQDVKIFLCYFLVDPSKIVYGLTTKGRPMLIYDEYTFIKQARMKNALAWECSQKRSLRCKAKIVVNNDGVNAKFYQWRHNHEPIKYGQRRRHGDLIRERKRFGLN